jgi:hypothetical protein
MNVFAKKRKVDENGLLLTTVRLDKDIHSDRESRLQLLLLLLLAEANGGCYETYAHTVQYRMWQMYPTQPTITFPNLIFTLHANYLSTISQQFPNKAHFTVPQGHCFIVCSPKIATTATVQRVRKAVVTTIAFQNLVTPSTLLGAVFLYLLGEIKT